MSQNGSKRVPNGFFISLEGPEGAGKSTQSKLIAEVLRERGYEVCETREPGGTKLGEELRHLVKHLCGPDAPCPESELMMMGASRAQLMQHLILPFLRDGGVVICDRFADSTTVYQGYARKLDQSLIREMHRVTTAGRWPDLTLVLDLDIGEGLHRSRVRGAAQAAAPEDRFESEPETFHHQVRSGFLKLADEEPQRVKIVPATGTVDEVHQRIMALVDHALS
jgi:dTMP kinase